MNLQNCLCYLKFTVLVFTAGACVAVTTARACVKKPVVENKTSTYLSSGLTPLPSPVSSAIPDMSLYRLPSHTIPVAYNIFLYPNLVTGLYNGTVKCLVRVNQETSDIKLHNNGLNITTVTINGQAAKWSCDKKHELLVASKEDGSKIGVGEVSLVVEYSGDLKNRIVGLYQSTYIDASGQKR